MYKIKAGMNWNQYFSEYCSHAHRPFEIAEGQAVDFIDEDTNIAIECKATDLHQSLYYDAAGNLEWELTQHYVGLFADVFLVIAGPQKDQDIAVALSLCCKYGVKCKWYPNGYDNAVKGIDHWIQHYNLEIDLTKPLYANTNKGVPLIYKMLRFFPGLTGDKLLAISKQIDPKMPPEEIIGQIESYLDSESSLYQKWFDWYHGGIEPKRIRGVEIE